MSVADTLNSEIYQLGSRTQGLKAARSSCRSFNDLIAPVLFATITLPGSFTRWKELVNGAIISPQKYTKHLIIKKSLDIGKLLVESAAEAKRSSATTPESRWFCIRECLVEAIGRLNHLEQVRRVRRLLILTWIDGAEHPLYSWNIDGEQQRVYEAVVDGLTDLFSVRHLMVNTATSIQSDGVIPAFPPIHRFTTLESLSVKCTYAQYQGNNNLLARMIAALLQANPGLKSLSIDHHGHSGDRSALYTLNNLFARKLEAQDEAEDDILKAIAGIDLGVTSGAEQLPLLPTGDLGAGESPLKYSIGLSLERLAIGTDLIDAQVSIDVIRRIRNLREFLTPIDTFRHGRLEQHQNLQNFWRVLERNRIALVTFQNDDIGHGCMDYLLSTTGQQSLAFTDPPSYPPSLRDSSVNWHPGFKSIHLHNLSSTNSQPRLESADSTEYGATFFTKILPHHSATLTKLILHCATPCSWCYEKKYLEILSQVRGLETLGLTVIWDVTALDDSEQKSTLVSF